MIEEKSTISSILEKDDWKLSDINPVYTQVPYNPIKKINAQDDFKHERPRANEKNSFRHNIPIDANSDDYDFDIKNDTTRVSQQNNEVQTLSNVETKTVDVETSAIPSVTSRKPFVSSTLYAASTQKPILNSKSSSVTLPCDI